MQDSRGRAGRQSETRGSRGSFDLAAVRLDARDLHGRRIGRHHDDRYKVGGLAKFGENETAFDVSFVDRLMVPDWTFPDPPPPPDDVTTEGGKPFSQLYTQYAPIGTVFTGPAG